MNLIKKLALWVLRKETYDLQTKMENLQTVKEELAEEWGRKYYGSWRTQTNPGIRQIEMEKIFNHERYTLAVKRCQDLGILKLDQRVIDEAEARFIKVMIDRM